MEILWNTSHQVYDVGSAPRVMRTWTDRQMRDQIIIRDSGRAVWRRGREQVLSCPCLAQFPFLT